MKKNLPYTFFLLLITFSLQLSAQTTVGISFCGKLIGPWDPKNSAMFTLEELNACELTLIPDDTTLTIVSFKASIAGKNIKYSEFDYTGNTIPEADKAKILHHDMNLFLEYITAKRRGSDQLLKLSAIGIKIE